jgi:hypothetical protein
MDTMYAVHLTSGPDIEEVHRLEDESEILNSAGSRSTNLVFGSAGTSWPIKRLLRLQQDEQLIDSWWFWVLLENNVEAYILWRPEDIWSSYLASFYQNCLIDTSDWGI